MGDEAPASKPSRAPGRRARGVAVLVSLLLLAGCTGTGVQLVDDDGGRVRFGIGLGGVAGYKVSELPPDRMYVDVAA